ncbi:MAG: NAD(P)-dependent oxidoreductase, partial [Pseudomonadota bacterium]
MEHSHLGVFGAGFSGQRIAAKAAKLGAAVWGTSRSVEKFETLSALGVNPIVFDGETIAEPIRSALKNTTHLVISVAPARDESS